MRGKRATDIQGFGGQIQHIEGDILELIAVGMHDNRRIGSERIGHRRGLERIPRVRHLASR